MFIHGRSVKGNGNFQSASAVNQAATADHNELPHGTPITCMADFNDGISARRITSSTNTATLTCTTGGSISGTYNGFFGTREASGWANNPQPPGAYFVGAMTMGGISGSATAVSSSSLTHGQNYQLRARVSDGWNNNIVCGNGSITTNSLPNPAPAAPVCGARGSAWNTKSTTVSASNVGNSENNTGNIGGSSTKTVTCPSGATFTRNNTQTDGLNRVSNSSSTTCYANCTPLPGGFGSKGCTLAPGAGCGTGACDGTPGGGRGAVQCPSWSMTYASTNGPVEVSSKGWQTVGGVTVTHYIKVCTAAARWARNCTATTYRVVTKTANGKTVTTQTAETRPYPQTCGASVTGSNFSSAGGCSTEVLDYYYW